MDNLPWMKGAGPSSGKDPRNETVPRFHDRTLATAVLFDQCPKGNVKRSVDLLAAAPTELGFSYPANAGWRLWALGKAGRADVITKDLRERWATLDSVRLNNTLQEDWKALPDSGSEWSHCPVAPLYVLYMSLAGIRPLAPGFQKYAICPQFTDLKHVKLAAQTPHGPLLIEAHGNSGDRKVTFTVPEAGEGILLLPEQERVSLPDAKIKLQDALLPAGRRAWRLEAGKTVSLQLKHV